MNETKSALYRTIARLIENGKTAGLEEKLDIFLAVGSLTVSEYQELKAMLDAKTSNAV